MSISEYIAKFEELCKFSTIYQRKPDEGSKYIKSEDGLKEYILPLVGPMEIKDYAVLVNKSRLVEKYKKKLVVAKSSGDASKKRLAT